MSATSATEEEQIGRRAVDSLTPLGMVATVKSGYAFKSKDWVDEGVPVVKIQNVRSGRVNLEGCAYVTEQVAAEAEKFRLVSGDVLITMSGEIGAIGVVRGDEHMLLNQRVGRFAIIDPARLDARFLFYLLSDPLLKLEMESIAYGAAQPNISPKLIEGLDVYLPGLRNQQRAAEILWAYDELIENNARRIEILEEMAQAIYREWFVEFRYPGHEDAALVDSELGPIPEGWGVTTVDAAFEISGGGTPSKTVTEYWEDGDIDWYTPTDLTAARSMFMSESKSKITKLGLAKSSAKLFPAGSVMMTSRATIGVVSISETEASTNQGFITCIPNDRYSAYFIVQWLRSSADVIDSLASGATFKEINKKNFREIKIVAPSEIALKRFQELVAPICDSIAVLLKSNRNLRETRDLLLPRLISGEIDVSGLDIELAGSSV